MAMPKRSYTLKRNAYGKPKVGCAKRGDKRRQGTTNIVCSLVYTFQYTLYFISIQQIPLYVIDLNNSNITIIIHTTLSFKTFAFTTINNTNTYVVIC